MFSVHLTEAHWKETDKKSLRENQLFTKSYVHLSLVNDVEVVSLITWNKGSWRMKKKKTPRKSPKTLVFELTLLYNCFSSNVVDGKHCIKNVTGETKKKKKSAKKGIENGFNTCILHVGAMCHYLLSLSSKWANSTFLSMALARAAIFV